MRRYLLTGTYIDERVRSMHKAAERHQKIVEEISFITGNSEADIRKRATHKAARSVLSFDEILDWMWWRAVKGAAIGTSPLKEGKK